MEKIEWAKIYCKECNIELSFNNIYSVKDLDFSKVGVYCIDCGLPIEDKLKEDRFVEEYRGNKIYCKDNKYSPYWQSGYYFMSLKDAKLRINNCEIGIYRHNTSR